MFPFSQHRRRIGVIAAASSIALVAAGLAGAPAAFAADRTSYPDAHPAWAQPSNDAGTAPDSTTYEGYIALPLQNAQAAQSFATAVSTPGSRSYHRFISAGQWISSYAPTRSDLAAAVAGLQQGGLVIEAVPTSRVFIAFRGTAAQFEQTFATSIHRYRVGGHTLLAPSTTPSLPDAVASHVAEVSISTGATARRPGASPAESSTTTGSGEASCSSYFGEKVATVPVAYGKTQYPTALCGYSAKQVRAVAGTGATDGAGQTVAIVDAYASPTIVTDTNRLSAAEGEPGISDLYSEIGVDRSRFNDQALCGGEEGWQIEQSLDVQSLHAVAPRSKVVYSAGFNCGAGIYSGISNVLDRQAASIVSNSFGEPEQFLLDADVAIFDALGWQAAAEGIGLYAGSGDEGDFTGEGLPKQVFYPAANPFFTAVGGTTVGIDRNGRTAFETGWGDAADEVTASGYASPLPGTFYFGAGGGSSTIYPEPAYQRHVVPDAIADGHRALPDIAALADPETGFQIGYSPILADGSTATDSFTPVTYGGTSLATPITSAQVAVAQQRTGLRLGFANPLLYDADRLLPSAFRDVRTSGPAALVRSDQGQSTLLFTLNQDTSLSTSRGWDTVTGIGALSLDGYRSLLQRR